MDRYRSYSAQDDLPITSGDDLFIGLNEYDAPESLQPGQVQAAVNCDFGQNTCGTRGGFVCWPTTVDTSLGLWWDGRAFAGTGTNFSAVAYGIGRFVAIAYSGVPVTMVSPNKGESWSSTAFTPPGSNNVWDLTFGNNLFVAVCAGGSGTQRVLTSPDGTTWTARTTPDDGYLCITYGGGKFVALSPDSTTNGAITSTDGITWTARTTAAGNTWYGVTYGDGLYVAVAGSGSQRVMTSPDGITWTARNSANDSLSWYSIVYGNGMFVAVSNTIGTSSIMTSTDGITWYSRTTPVSAGWVDITFGAGQFVAIAETTTVTSTNGVDWVERENNVNGDWVSVAYGAGRYVKIQFSLTGGTVADLAYAQTVFASGTYVDPYDTTTDWVVVCGAERAGFFAFGRSPRYVEYPSGFELNAQATIVQADNYLIIMGGEDQTPVRWSGDWTQDFAAMPDTSSGAGFVSIPHSDHATYYVNRLWVKSGKDEVAASDLLDFATYDDIYQSFNLNVGTPDYVVCTYPFGVESLLVFKNRAIQLLQSVAGSLDDVVATEVTRQVGIIGINAVVGVGPDVVYMSDRNINTIRLTDTSNSVQHQTEPLSRNIKSILRRINWNVASRASMAYWDNKLFVAVPLDNADACNAVIVYNFVTGQWWGEWTADEPVNLRIQSFAVARYNGAVRLHMVMEDGRVFVTGEGFNDIMGSTTHEVEYSMTTRAYRMDNNNRVNRRMWADLGTNRPNFSVTSYVDGANEYSHILTNQTYSRDQTWIFNDTDYSLDNSNDDFNRAGRKDYATGTATTTDSLVDSSGDNFVTSGGDTIGIGGAEGIQCGTGFLPEMLQDYRYPLITRRKGRLTWFKLTNASGRVDLRGIGAEARAGDRSNLVQAI